MEANVIRKDHSRLDKNYSLAFACFFFFFYQQRLMNSLFTHINSIPYMNSNFFIVFSFQQNKRYSNGL